MTVFSKRSNNALVLTTRLALVIVLLVAQLGATKIVNFTAQGVSWTMTTQYIGDALTKTGHWLYSPTVILPDSVTGNQYVMLIAMNETPNISNQRDVVRKYTSSGPTGFSQEQVILRSSDTDNICDMIGPRAVYDAASQKWHVYLQARFKVGSQCPEINHIVKAEGPSLTLGGLQWVKDPGNNNAKKILTSSGGGVGIGEDHQWFRWSGWNNFMGPWKIQAFFNNWDFMPTPGSLFSYLSQDGSNVQYWYGPINQAYVTPQNPNLQPVSHYPDIFMGDIYDTAWRGDPGFGFQSHCRSGANKFQYAGGFGFYDNLFNYSTVSGPNVSPSATAIVFSGSSTIETKSSNTNGPIMFRPRAGRNIYGGGKFLGFPAGDMEFYLYYTSTQINELDSHPCNNVPQYTSWNQRPQTISVTKVVMHKSGPSSP